jgi:hypothetical protein
MDPRQEKIRLQALFSDLKQDDERRAPSFQRCLRIAGARGSRFSTSYARWAMVAAIVLAFGGVAGVALFSRLHRQTALVKRSHILLPEDPAGSAFQPISSWHSPTAFLLEAPVFDSKPASRFDEDWMIPSRSRDQRPLF